MGVVGVVGVVGVSGGRCVIGRGVFSRVVIMRCSRRRGGRVCIARKGDGVHEIPLTRRFDGKIHILYINEVTIESMISIDMSAPESSLFVNK